ncbi:MAG: nucleoside kinase, partial [Nocardioides sp.]
SGTGKTSVCHELRRRGHHAVNGDTDLAYQGDPLTGEPLPGGSHEHHLWDVNAVRALVADRSRPVTFLCGGSRNFTAFLHLLDGVFVLTVDRATLERRLDLRAGGEWGSRPEERALVLRLHASGEDVPREGVRVEATAPLEDVVDEILRRVGLAGG